MKLSPNVLLMCVTAVVITCLGIAGWILANGGDPERILGWTGTTVGPLIAGLGALVIADKVRNTVDVVKQQTNGALTRMGERLEEVADAAGLPAPSGEPGPADHPYRRKTDPLPPAGR